MPEYKAVVSGAGIVGLAAAHTLAKAGYPTLVLDDGLQQVPKGDWDLDLRQITVAQIAMDQLKDLGVNTPDVKGEIQAMHVWEGDGSAAVTMASCDVGCSRLAWVIEQRLLERSLREKSSDNLTILTETTVTDINVNTREVTLSNEQTIRPELLIIAEGFRSNSRRLMGVGFQFDNDLHSKAVVTLARNEREHNHIAWQIFNPTPLALLPCADKDMVSVIWSLPNEKAEEVLQLDDSTFQGELSTACESVCGQAVQVDKRVAFPLGQSVVSDFNPYRWILMIGDTARRIHPLAGQGVNLGLEDVRAMLPVLKKKPEELSQPGLWRNYAEKRKIRSMMMSGTMAFFNNVYGSSSPFFRLMRNTGVRFMNQSPVLKRQIIREAMGVGHFASIQ